MFSLWGWFSILSDRNWVAISWGTLGTLPDWGYKEMKKSHTGKSLLGWRSFSIPEAQCAYYIIQQRDGVIACIQTGRWVIAGRRGYYTPSKRQAELILVEAVSRGEQSLDHHHPRREKTLAGIFCTHCQHLPSPAPATHSQGPQAWGPLTWQCQYKQQTFTPEVTHSWVASAFATQNTNAWAGQVHADSGQQVQKFCMFN